MKEILRLDILKDEYKDLIYSDEDFKYQWGNSNSEYTEDIFWEWLKAVFETSTQEDLQKYIEVL